MRFLIGREAWCFFDGRDEPGSESARFRGNESAALQWLERFRGDFAAMSAFRNELMKGSPAISLNDREVLQRVATQLAGGHWNVSQGGQAQTGAKSMAGAFAGGAVGLDSGPQIGPPGIGPGPDGETVEFGPPFPLEYRRKFTPSTGGGEAQQPLFPNDADLKTIADGQKRAAKNGIALCEECMKAKAASGG